jgi:hypothetical protein
MIGKRFGAVAPVYKRPPLSPLPFPPIAAPRLYIHFSFIPGISPMFLGRDKISLTLFFFFFLTVIRRVAAFKIRLPSGSSFVFFVCLFPFSLLVTVQYVARLTTRERLEKKKKLACLVLFRLVSGSVTRVSWGEGASSLGILYSPERRGRARGWMARRGAGSATLTVETREDDP